MAMSANLALALPFRALCSRIYSIQQLPSQRFHHPKCSLPNFSLSTPYPTAPSDALSAIQDSGVIASLRAESAQLAIEAAHAAVDGGVTVLEIVISTPGVFEVLEKLVQYYPTKTFGVGTVLNLEDAKNAIKFGAKFLLSPATVKDILDYASGCEALYVPGAMTPTEVLATFNAGGKLIKMVAV